MYMQCRFWSFLPSPVLCSDAAGMFFSIRSRKPTGCWRHYSGSVSAIALCRNPARPCLKGRGRRFSGAMAASRRCIGQSLLPWGTSAGRELCVGYPLTQALDYIRSTFRGFLFFTQATFPTGAQSSMKGGDMPVSSLGQKQRT